MSVVSRQQKEKLKEDLERLTQCEHEQIFKMVRESTDQYTCSETGVLVSADNLTPECFSKIEQYVRFCFEQKKHLEEGEAARERLKMDSFGSF